MSGILYVISTPIGNLEDITLRAINTLKSVNLIAAEDTRHTLKLLNHFFISKPLISLHRHNENNKFSLFIDKLQHGENIALVSDAGTPAISDPGEILVKNAIENNIKVVPIPGVSALITALSCSGLSTSEFCFIGFLPTNKKLRKQKLVQLENENKTLIFYEAPHKIKESLGDILSVFGDRPACIARELTKIHEEFIRGNLSNIISTLQQPKGEFVILVEGINNPINSKVDFSNISIEEHFNLYKNCNLDKKEIIKKIAKDRNVNKNEIYKHFI